ncbi:MAG: hypothetical protein NPIRA01_22820 [Nitrospirales bacterium]|nr:MAG: hypothetical protein NPIRA01_22820 [Nitrospirales bacterium]
MIRHIAMLVLAFLYVVSPNPPLAEEAKTAWPLQTNEWYQYSVSLLGIPAGTGTLQARHEMPPLGQPRLRLMSTAQSNDFISLFFPVNNLVDSTLDADTLLPQHFIFQRREGNDHEDFDVTFHHGTQEVTIVKDGKLSTMPISSDTHGPLSFLYYVRNLQRLDPGRSIPLHVHHDKKNYEIEVKVEEIEELSGPWGEVEAIRFEAVMPFRGIFANQGSFHFWLTNDHSRVPLMMQAKVIVGSVKAVLEGWTP